MTLCLGKLRLTTCKDGDFMCLGVLYSDEITLKIKLISKVPDSAPKYHILEPN